MSVAMTAKFANAELYISAEARGNVPVGRAAASLLDYEWRQLVRDLIPDARFDQPDNLADERLSGEAPTSGVLEFPLVGLSVAYSYRQMSDDLFGTEQGARPTYAARLGEPAWSPLPDKFIGTGYEGGYYTTVIDTKTNLTQRCAVMFDFSRPVTAFGLYVGDLESRPAGRLAELRLFNADLEQINSTDDELRPTGVLVGVEPGTYDVDSTVADFDGAQWGNNTTQFIGFYDSPPVSRMLLIVGDEDLGQFGLTEHIVFYGGTAVGRMAGDYDLDGDSDGNDFLVWQRQLGASVPSSADWNRDGVVGAADLAAWQTAFGNRVRFPSAGTTIPEPSTLGLAVAGVCYAIRRLFVNPPNAQAAACLTISGSGKNSPPSAPTAFAGTCSSARIKRSRSVPPEKTASPRGITSSGG